MLGQPNTNWLRRLWQWAFAGLMLVAAQAHAHSVGQVQTTKYFAPETVNMLTARAAAGSAGFVVGDTVTYIIQFSPIANNATYGANGYVTDYIPSGVEVVQASFVQKDSAGNFYDVTPALPGTMPDGWGASGANTYNAPFNVATYDTTGRCTSAGRTNNCNGRFSQLYADTGIFYSTDSRTAQYPSLPTRVSQTVNGYVITPTRQGQLNPILGQASASTHNLWDAAMTNAFGTTALPTTSPNANSTVGILSSSGSGSVPFNAGSPVAGPDTGYQLDYTANVGPWKRIYYAGSRIGDNSTGPALAISYAADRVTFDNTNPYSLYLDGSDTTLGYTLSSTNPLPSGTNAVRWAIGRLVVGQISYVKITLRITAPLPSAGLINGSEVFGGDASDLTGAGTAGSIDNPWPYHVPSVADNNSNLYVNKITCDYDSTATSCTPMTGSYVAANATLTYKITYLNTGNADQHNVQLIDTLPCQTQAAASMVRVGTVTGPLAAVMTGAWSVPVVTQTISGNCGSTPQFRQTLTFPTIATVGPGGGGFIIMNVRNTATTANDDILNAIEMKSSEVSPGATSVAVNYVTAGAPVLSIAKTSPQTTATAPGTVTYTITLTNTGLVTATGTVIWDFLPSTGGSTTDTTVRFNYLPNSTSYVSTGFVTATGLVTATTMASLSGVSPYNTQPGASNTVAISWDFGVASRLAPGGKITLTFAATVGGSVPASDSPYYNNAYATTSTFNISSGPSAPILISTSLTVSKTMECYYTSTTSTVCVPPNAGNNIPSNARVRYLISYANTGASSIGNVVLQETLPCQTNATSAPTATLTITALTTAAIQNTGSVATFTTLTSTGTCPSTRAVVTMPAVTLTAGVTGTVSFELQLNTTATGNTYTVVTNNVSLKVGTQTYATDQHQSTVQTLANLNMTKSVTPSTIMAGQTVTYTLVISNAGTTAAQSITVYDVLPSSTSTFGATTGRYNTVTNSVSFQGMTTVTTVTSGTPTVSPYNTVTTNSYYPNNQQVSWNFGAQTLGVGSSMTITFAATAGSAMTTGTFYNQAMVSYLPSLSSSSTTTATASAGNVLNAGANLSVSKTNSVGTVTAGGTTTYTIVVSNAGPSDAGGSKLLDTAHSSLSCSTFTCSAVGGTAVCPTGTTLGVATSTTSLMTGSGITLNSLPSGSSLTFTVTCGVN